MSCSTLLVSCEGFYKDSANLFICWECKAILSRICGFRHQACKAQKELSLITEGRADRARNIRSKLSCMLKTTYDRTFICDNSEEIIDNFIDCGPIVDIKPESDLDDVPLAELHSNSMSNDNEKLNKENTALSLYTKSLKSNHLNENQGSNRKVRPVRKRKLSKESSKENSTLIDSNKKYYATIEMNEEEMTESRNERKRTAIYADAAFKCDTCIEGFKLEIELEGHNLDNHKKREKRTICDICQSYVKKASFKTHRRDHYLKYSCQLCDFMSYKIAEMICHLKSEHAIKNLVLALHRKKNQRKKYVVKNPGSKPRRNKAMKDKGTPFGFLCSECNKYFETKNLRWKHIQRHHREGFECTTCGKRFPFKNNLNRHTLTHTSPPTREECAVCHKQVRADLMRTHLRIHGARERFACAQCDKTFASRPSYEHHLKYTLAHAVNDILKYKCSVCDKGYRSKGELRDHINYQHMGKTQHKCPVCGKALATRRCITRHVRRAHHGIKENERDKICQQCGKAFRDKKGLREHEFIHTGERPLSCEICGCTFRQSASLYTHRKRVHKIYPRKINVELMESEVSNANQEVKEKT
ncbi:unnamed protein product [Parnassius apollo]|uniref:(apollo) hypothetical protein n=1 Tax=Parnassius apollo TaxID=110799 RepID=A0A8S3X3S9_PARAO|nr:unnamed protein product [Parnassius apollo]